MTTIFETKLQCPICKNKTTIQRLRSRKRAKDHVKDLYCYKCKKRTSHVELHEDFDTSRIWGT